MPRQDSAAAARHEGAARHAGSAQSRVGRPVLWITLAWAGMLGLFLLAVPIYQAPDENTHVDRILSAAVVGFPEYDELRYLPETAASMSLLRLTARPDPLGAADAPERPRPTFGELSGGPPTDVVNQLAGHPPAYYGLMSGLRTGVTALLPQDAWAFDRDVLLLRVLNVLLLLGLPWILARTALLVGLRPWQAWIAAAVPLAIPQLAHIGSAVNNDNLLVLACALATMFAADVLTRGLRWAPTLGMAVATGIAIQTKVFGWALVPLVLAAAVAGTRRDPGTWPRAAAALVLIAGSGWTYLRNLVLHGHPYPTLAAAGQPVAPEGFQLDVVAFVAHWVGNTVQTFFGKFGWLWLPLPRAWVVMLAVALLGCLVHAALRPARPGVRSLLLPVAVIGVLYLYTSYEVHMSTGAYAAQQGRYLFPVVASLGVAVASATARLGPRSAGATVLLVAAIGWVLSAWTLMQGFWHGSGIARLDSLTAWSPVGGAAVVGLVIAVAAFWLGVTAASRGMFTRAEG